MADWIHCNSCACSPSANAQKFFLANCGHVFCQICISSATRGMCSICGQQCSLVEINRQMKPEIQSFFMDPSEVVTKPQKQIIQVMDFQKAQRERMLAHFKGQEKKAHAMFNQFQQEMRKKQDLANELVSAKEECRRLMLTLQNKNVSSSNNAFRVPFTPATTASKRTIRQTPLFTPRSGGSSTIQIAPVQPRLTPTSDRSGSRVSLPVGSNLTTPRLLGLDREMEDGDRSRTVSPMTISPRIEPVVAINNVPDVQQIRLPFRLSAGSLPR